MMFLLVLASVGLVRELEEAEFNVLVLYRPRSLCLTAGACLERAAGLADYMR